MPHSSHKLKCYTADPKKPLVFCCLCGKEEDEGLDKPCAETFYESNKITVDTVVPKFYSGLPFIR